MDSKGLVVLILRRRKVPMTDYFNDIRPVHAFIKDKFNPTPKWYGCLKLPISYERMFFLATHFNDLETIRFLLDNRYSYQISYKQELDLLSDTEILNNAAWLGRTEIVEMILDTRVLDDLRDSMTQAIQQGHVQTAALLKKRGADYFSSGAAGMAVMNGRIDMVRWLSKEHPDVFSYISARSIMVALRKGYFDIAKIVLDYLIKDELRNDSPISEMIKNIWSVYMVHAE